jgi:hypothetical protein
VTAEITLTLEMDLEGGGGGAEKTGLKKQKVSGSASGIS